MQLALESSKIEIILTKQTTQCRSLCSVDCFENLNYGSTEFQLKIKEAIHIKLEKPFLNPQVKHVNLKLSLYFLYSSLP